MTEARWAQVKALFQASVERPLSERAAFLSAAAGSDEPLRREVESLLRSDDPDAALTNLLQRQDASPRRESIETHDVPSDDTRTETASAIWTTIGPYRVVGLLGAGGMGEVFRARDSKLNRDVALKLLPGAFASDPDRLARFRREARALAALNHPNIGAIYGLEESDGRQALVLELVDGVTLAERIAGGPLPVRETLTLARQIAAALEAAHDKGIVHRDLKPANIKVTAAGVVKVLDFGLAKTAAAERTAAEAVPSLLTADGRTRVGAVVGTAAYMSPEQARGIDVDIRTDIWAFGCVLFEMLSGRKAFGAGADSDSTEKVLAREPDWAALPASTPVKVRGLLRRCLEKDPARRLQTIAEAHQLVDRLLKGGSLTRRVAAAAVAAAVLATAALGAFIAYWLVWSGRSAEEISSQWSFSRLTDQPGQELYPSLSPDGQSLVYASRASGNWDVYFQRVGGETPLSLTKGSASDDTQPAFSPDGQRIAFRSEREGGGLFVMEATGENTRRLSAQGFHPSWSPDGKEIAAGTVNFRDPEGLASRSGQLIVVEVATGRSRLISEAQDVHQPHWSPHGYRIAYWGRPGEASQRDLWTVAATGSASVRVTNDAPTDWNPVWSADGRWLFFSSNRGGSMNLWRLRIDEASGTVLGQPEPVPTPSPYSGYLSFARDGRRIAYAQITFADNLFKIEFDPSREVTVGQPTSITRGTRSILHPDLSPNGEWVAAQTGVGEAQDDVVVVRTDGSGFSTLTDDADRDREPKWSPDGKTIAFHSDRSGTSQVWTINADGSSLRQLTDSDIAISSPVWSPDGRMAFRTDARGQRPARVLVLDVRKPWSEQTPEAIAFSMPDDVPFVPFSWSPDGRRLALTAFGPAPFAGTYTYDFETRRAQKVSDLAQPWQGARW
ncbi:MAG TPA: protein kinase, partial [Gemmatimonadales bacterium]|nr:protein kinase [Gemmatimonadales bacterium]